MLPDPFVLYLSAMLLGTTAGLISGLLPGFGNLMAMLLLFPFIQHWDATAIFLCYASLTIISQYVGSITTLYTGVPGEASSMPLVTELKNLKPGEIPSAIATTAIGSTVAGVFAIAVLLGMLPFLFKVSWIYRTDVTAIFFIVATALIVYSNSQPKTVNFLLLIGGIALGSIGWNETLAKSFMTFNVTNLYQGLPLELVLVFLFAIPQLMQMSNVVMVDKITNIKFVKVKIKWLLAIVHSALGFVGGLVPGMTTVMSSQLSHAVSRRFNPSPSDRIFASETANNAGAISQLIPMLVIGLPLIASEAMVLDLMELQGYVATPQSATDIILTTLPFLIGVVIMGLVLAWPLASKLLSLLTVKIKVIRVIILSILLTTIYVQSYNDSMLSFYLTVGVFLIPLTLALRKFDTTPLIFGFLISDKLWEYSIRSISLYT